MKQNRNVLRVALSASNILQASEACNLVIHENRGSSLSTVMRVVTSTRSCQSMFLQKPRRGLLSATRKVQIEKQ